MNSNVRKLFNVVIKIIYITENKIVRYILSEFSGSYGDRDFYVRPLSCGTLWIST
jgi:hypothetical protein